MRHVKINAQIDEQIYIIHMFIYTITHMHKDACVCIKKAEQNKQIKVSWTVTNPSGAISQEPNFSGVAARLQPRGGDRNVQSR